MVIKALAYAVPSLLLPVLVLPHVALHDMAYPLLLRTVSNKLFFSGVDLSMLVLSHTYKLNLKYVLKQLCSTG